MVELTKAQREWLMAFQDGPPVEMAWLDEQHLDAAGPPNTWVWLMATWEGGQTAVIHTDQRPGLEPYFDPGKWSLTTAARQAIAHATGGDHG